MRCASAPPKKRQPPIELRQLKRMTWKGYIRLLAASAQGPSRTEWRTLQNRATYRRNRRPEKGDRLSEKLYRTVPPFLCIRRSRQEPGSAVDSKSRAVVFLFIPSNHPNLCAISQTSATDVISADGHYGYVAACRRLYRRHSNEITIINRAIIERETSEDRVRHSQPATQKDS